MPLHTKRNELTTTVTIVPHIKNNCVLTNVDISLSITKPIPRLKLSRNPNVEQRKLPLH